MNIEIYANVTLAEMLFPLKDYLKPFENLFLETTIKPPIGCGGEYNVLPISGYLTEKMNELAHVETFTSNIENNSWVLKYPGFSGPITWYQALYHIFINKVRVSDRSNDELAYFVDRDFRFMKAQLMEYMLPTFMYKSKKTDALGFSKFIVLQRELSKNHRFITQNDYKDHHDEIFTFISKVLRIYKETGLFLDIAGTPGMGPFVKRNVFKRKDTEQIFSNVHFDNGLLKMSDFSFFDRRNLLQKTFIDWTIDCIASAFPEFKDLKNNLFSKNREA
jgi:hypothetical protein